MRGSNLAAFETWIEFPPFRKNLSQNQSPPRFFDFFYAHPSPPPLSLAHRPRGNLVRTGYQGGRRCRLGRATVARLGDEPLHPGPRDGRAPAVKGRRAAGWNTPVRAASCVAPARERSRIYAHPGQEHRTGGREVARLLLDERPTAARLLGSPEANRSRRSPQGRRRTTGSRKEPVLSQ